MDEENQSEVKTEHPRTKEALREGDSLRAKFFRWKDLALGAVDQKEISKHLKSGDDDKSMDVIMRAYEAKEAMVRSPDDQATFDSAIEAIRGMASLLKGLGLPADPDAPVP